MSLGLERWLEWLESVDLFERKKENSYLVSNRRTV